LQGVRNKVKISKEQGTRLKFPRSKELGYEFQGVRNKVKISKEQGTRL